MTTSQNERALDGLVASARGEMSAGREDEAARLWQQVLQFAPNHPQALFFFGHRTLRRGNPKSALELLQRAAVSDPKDAMIRVAIAGARRHLGDMTGETVALEEALQIEPYCVPALLLKGKLLERLGKPRQAASIYQNALKIVPKDEHLPADLRELATAARQLVAKNASDLAMILHARLRSALPQSALSDRVQLFADVAAGKKKVFAVEPTGLHIPGLPAVQFFDASQFPWREQLESQAPVILTELRALLESEAAEFKPYVMHPKGVPLNQWAELNYSPRWSAYFFLKDGVHQDLNCRRCPQTSGLLSRIPLIDIPRAAPTAFYSSLTPHTRIPPHTGVTNARAIVHLPLIVPQHCGFRVGNETREWQVGKALVFDDTMEHEAWNDSDQLRVVLIFDIWNPFLSESEREAVRLLHSALQDYYESSSS